MIKRFIIFLFLILLSGTGLIAQKLGPTYRTIKGKHVVNNGFVIVPNSSPYVEPVEPPDPPSAPVCDTTITDSRIIFKENFCTWDISTQIDNDVLQSHWGPNANLHGLPSGETTNYTSWITDFEGRRALYSFYPEGECCYKSDGLGVTTTGTGFFAHVDRRTGDEIWNYDTLILSWKYRATPGFILPKAHKNLGFRTENADGSLTAGVRIVMNNGGWVGGPGSEYIAPSFYWYDINSDAVNNNGKNVILDPDTTYVICLGASAGTASTPGKIKMWIGADTLQTGQPLKLTLISTQTMYFRNASHSGGFNVFKPETNMGGGDDSYDSPQDQGMYTMDIGLWVPSAAAFDATDLAPYYPREIDGIIEESEPADSTDGETALDLNVYLAKNFESMDLGLQNVTTASAYLPIASGSPNDGLISGRDTTCRVIEEEDGNRAWKVSQAAGSWGVRGQLTGGPVSDPGGGMDIYIETGAPTGAREIYVSYNYKLRLGYHFAKGGKFPGVKSSNHTSTTIPPCDGYSFGLAFRYDSALWCPCPPPPDPCYCDYSEGIAFYYNCYNVYREGTMNSYSPCGVFTPGVYSRIYSIYDSIGSSSFSRLAQEGKWGNITIRIVLNTHATPNGIVEVFLDELLAGRVSGLLLDTGADPIQTAVDLIKFYWFYGGGDPTYAALYDEWVLFDDLWVFTYGSSYTTIPRGNTLSSNGRRLDLPNGQWIGGQWVKGQR